MDRLLSDRLLNLRSHVTHRYPAFESCNVDAIPERHRFLYRADESHFKVFRYCKRCFKQDA